LDSSRYDEEIDLLNKICVTACLVAGIAGTVLAASGSAVYAAGGGDGDGWDGNGHHSSNSNHNKHHIRIRVRNHNKNFNEAEKQRELGKLGEKGDKGDKGASNLGLDTAFQGNRKFIGLVQANGHTMIRDPRTSPRWNDISTLGGYPSGVTDVSLAVMGNELHVTVRGSGDTVAQTSCTVNTTPGTGSNPAWPGNCTVFDDFTPPMLAPQAVGPSMLAPPAAGALGRTPPGNPTTAPLRRPVLGILGFRP
jgi:hypothetical protein